MGESQRVISTVSFVACQVKRKSQHCAALTLIIAFNNIRKREPLVDHECERCDDVAVS